MRAVVDDVRVSVPLLSNLVASTGRRVGVVIMSERGGTEFEPHWQRIHNGDVSIFPILLLRVPNHPIHPPCPARRARTDEWSINEPQTVK